MDFFCSDSQQYWKCDQAIDNVQMRMKNERCQQVTADFDYHLVPYAEIGSRKVFRRLTSPLFNNIV